MTRSTSGSRSKHFKGLYPGAGEQELVLALPYIPAQPLPEHGLNLRLVVNHQELERPVNLHNHWQPPNGKIISPTTGAHYQLGAKARPEWPQTSKDRCQKDHDTLPNQLPGKPAGPMMSETTQLYRPFLCKAVYNSAISQAHLTRPSTTGTGSRSMESLSYLRWKARPEFTLLCDGRQLTLFRLMAIV